MPPAGDRVRAGVADAVEETVVDKTLALISRSVCPVLGRTFEDVFQRCGAHSIPPLRDSAWRNGFVGSGTLLLRIRKHESHVSDDLLD